MDRKDDESKRGITRHTLRDASGKTNRRTFLRATAGAAVLAGGLSAAGQTAADEEYAVVLDIVEDLGADNTGSEPINDALAAAVADIEYDVSSLADIEDIEYEDGDSVKVVFPPGEYVIHEGAKATAFRGGCSGAVTSKSTSASWRSSATVT